VSGEIPCGMASGSMGSNDMSSGNIGSNGMSSVSMSSDGMALGCNHSGCMLSDGMLSGGVGSGCSALKKADVVFNTVPAKLLNYTALSMLKSGTPVIDLASKPGGVDFEAARTLGTNIVWALSLPGKTAPVTAGEIICSTVLTIMEEYGAAEREECVRWKTRED